MILNTCGRRKKPIIKIIYKFVTNKVLHKYKGIITFGQDPYGRPSLQSMLYDWQSCLAPEGLGWEIINT